MSGILSRAGIGFAALLFCAAAAFGQCASYTQVTGTITDPNNIPYSGGTVTLDLSATGQIPTCTGTSGGQVQFSTHLGPLPLSSTGSFAVQLPPDSIITPSGTQWIFTIAIAPGVAPPWGTGPQSFTDAITISGSSQSVSAALSALAPALTAIPPGTSPTKVGPNMGAIYLSPYCSGQSNCYTTYADTQLVTDASFTSGSPTITTGANDPIFRSTDVGKRAQATRDCNGVANNPEKCGGGGAPGLGCPDTTIAAYVSAHVVTLAANCTNSSTTGSTNNKFAWGHADDTGIANAVAAIEAQGYGTIYIPCTGMWVEQPAFILHLPNVSTTTRGPMGVAGCPGGGSVIVPGFNFNYAALVANEGAIFDDNNVADNNLYSYAGGGDLLRDVDIQGLGIDCTSCSFGSQFGAVHLESFQEIQNVHINGWNWNAPSNFDGVLCAGGKVLDFFINAGGANAINVISLGCYIDRGFANNGGAAGLLVQNGTVTSHQVEYYSDSQDGCYPGGGAGTEDAVVQTGGYLAESQDFISNFCGHAGQAYLTDIWSLGPGGFIAGYNGLGEVIHAKGVDFSTTGNYYYFVVPAGDTLYDDGGNLPGLAPVIGGNLFGSQSITGVPQTSGDFVLSAGWGTGAAVSAVSGADRLAQFTVTAGTSPTANPTVTITFPAHRWGDGFWTSPICSAAQTGGTGGSANLTPTAVSKTAVTFQWTGTPVASSTYTIAMGCSNP